MKKFIFLGNNTLHRRYFLSRLLEKGVKFEKIFFETNSLKPIFNIHSIFDSEEKYFEQDNFTNLLDFETIESIDLVFNAVLMHQNDEIIFRKQNKIERY
jgi:hypothetical protein